MNIIQPNKFTLNAFRGILAILILVHHYDPLNTRNYIDLGAPIVLFFFMLSGFLMYYNWNEKILSDGASTIFLKKRLPKIYSIQWISLILLILLNIIMTSKVVTESIWTIPCQFLLIQSFIPLWEINFSFNTPSWFLSSILFCYLMTPTILKFIKRKGFKKFSCGLFLCFLGYYLLLYLLPDSIGRRWLTYINPGVRLLEYSVGILMGYIWVRYNKNLTQTFDYIKVSMLELSILICTVAISFFTVLNQYLDFIQYTPNLLRIITFSFLILIFSIGQGFISKLLHNKVFQYIGDLSMMIYIIHIIPFSITVNYIYPHTSVWLSFAILIALTLVISHLLNKFAVPVFVKYTTKLFDKILNFRINKYPASINPSAD